MSATLAQRLIELLNRFFGPRNPYFECMTRSPEEAFQYSIRSGAVVYRQFYGFNDFADKVVLDFGCGGGGKTIYYAGCGARRTIGVDHDCNPRQAIEYAEKTRLSVEFLSLKPDGAIPLPPNTCDVVISSSVLEHLENLPHSLSELRRVLKPDGLLLSRWHPFRSRYGAHLWAAIGIPYGHLLFREEDLVSAYYRNLHKRFGKIPDAAGRVSKQSTTFADLSYHLNRKTVRQMRDALIAAGFEPLETRFLRGRREIVFPKYLPARLTDYLIDYEIQVLRNRKQASPHAEPVSKPAPTKTSSACEDEVICAGQSRAEGVWSQPKAAKTSRLGC